MSRRSLRRSLISQTLLLALLPVLGALLVSAFVLYTTFFDEIKERNRTITAVAAQSVDFFLKETRDQLQLMRDEANRRAPLLEGERYFNSQRLMSIVWNLEQIESIKILDPEGIVQQVFPPNPRIFEGYDASGFPFVKNGEVGDGVWWSDMVESIYPGIAVFDAALAFNEGWIVLSFNPLQLMELVHRGGGEEYFTAIVNTHGTYIAHPDHDQVQERHKEPEYRRFQEDGAYREGSGFTWYRGERYLINVTPVLLNDWAVVSYQRVSQVFEGLREALLLFALLLTAAVGSAILYGLRKIGKIVEPLEEVRRKMAGVERRDFSGYLDYRGYRELEELVEQFNEMRRELAATYSELSKELQEKKALLREVHHRVKNNLQMVISLLHLQSERAGPPEAEQILKESAGRLLSVALIYEQFYASESFSTVTFREYLMRSAELIIGGFEQGSRITIDFALEDIYLDISQAVPLGIIAHELLNNAVTHAFTERDSGTLRVELFRREDGQVCMAVKDDGSGLPEGFDFSDGDTIGSLLVATLTQQIGGQLTVESGRGGSSFTVCFTPKRPD